MLVTALEPRRKRLTALFLDGELAAKLDSETLLQSGLRIGMELDDEELYRLIQRSDAHRAQEKALYLLEHRSHSKKELADKISRTAGREAAERAAERMEELGLVNDAQYARNLAEELLRRVSGLSGGGGNVSRVTLGDYTVSYGSSAPGGSNWAQSLTAWRKMKF